MAEWVLWAIHGATQGPGGTRVTISGTGYTNDTRVSYGAQLLNVVGRRGDNQIDVLIPRKTRTAERPVSASEPEHLVPRTEAA